MSINQTSNSNINNLLSSERDALQIETLLNNPSEWQSNPVETTRECLKSLYNLIKINQISIGNIDQDKASKTDLSSSLSIKANIADIMRTFSEVASNMESRPTMEEIQIFLDEKVSKEELTQALANKISYEEIRSKLGNGDLKINLKLTMDELKTNFVTTKDFSEFQTASKANRENIINILHKKANKNDLDNLKSTKVNTQDFSDFINNFEAKQNSKLENLEKAMMETNEKKYDKKIADIDNDVDRLVDNIKKQFQSVNNVLNNLTTNKADYKEIENFVKSTKANDDYINQMKLELYDSINKAKSELFNSMNNLDGNNKKETSDIRKMLIQNVGDLKNEFQSNINYINDEIVKLNKLLSQTSNQNDLELINKKLEDMSSLIDIKKSENNLGESNMFDSKYVSYPELDNFYKTIQKNIENKFTECQLYTQDYIKSFDNDIQEILDKKSNTNEMISYLNKKANLNEITLQLDKKLSKNEFECFKMSLEKIVNDSQNKIDYQKFDAFVSATTQTLDALQKDIIMKANMKEMMDLFRKKADIDDVNNSLNSVFDQMESHIPIEEYKQALENQNRINNIVMNENSVGKWLWKTGEIRSGYCVPWEEEIINTRPENFIRSKENTLITVAQPGIYLLTAVFFVMTTPSIEVMINGNPVVSKVKNTDDVVRHEILSESEEYKGGINCGMSSVCLKEYLNLEDEKSRLSISYTGSDNVKGLLCLSKI